MCIYVYIYVIYVCIYIYVYVVYVYVYVYVYIYVYVYVYVYYVFFLRGGQPPTPAATPAWCAPPPGEALASIFAYLASSWRSCSPS